MSTLSYAIIGAGPTGLAAARALQREHIPFDGYEASHDVGGLWDITNPRSTMYESAHLISSRTTTEFAEFPMRSHIDYPGHRVLKQYFADFADHFGLREHFAFNTRVSRIERDGDDWLVTADGPGGTTTTRHRGVILANGTLAEPNIPSFNGSFDGEIMHSSAYKSGDQLRDKRVLIIGAGNSGCDIAVDAVHHAQSIDMSVRRGYYFVPRYIFGRPSDTLNQGKPLPTKIKQFIDRRVLQAFTGNPVAFGFPKPDYKIYESHPIVNTLILNHLGQGDLSIRADIDRFDGSTVHFRDGSSSDYDLILLATGYKLDYPFVDRAELNWSSASPELYLNIFTPTFTGLYVLGMIEASGIGWQGRMDQANLVATYIAALDRDPDTARTFRAKVATDPWPDLSGGYNYLGLDRMSYYVNKDAYKAAVKKHLVQLNKSVRRGISA